MRTNPLHIAILLTALLLSLSSCDTEYFDDSGEKNTQVLVELFTRIGDYNTPISRASADENKVGKEPWLLVFRGSDENATFVEAVQAYTVSATSKTYAELTAQATGTNYQILILANPESKFYVGGSTTNYDYSVENFTTALAGQTLGYACNNLLTMPLNNPQTSVPFVNTAQDIPLPMSYLLTTGLNGITHNTQIGTSTEPLKLSRAVAKIIVKSDNIPNFELLGITYVGRVSVQGKLHNLNATTITSMVNYSNSTGSIYTDIAPAVSQDTSPNPIYIFESTQANNTKSVIIIRAKYNGEECFYRMAFIDNSQNVLDIVRNHSYIFTIKDVKKAGYETIGDAIGDTAFDNLDQFSTSLTVIDASGYETTAYRNRYLSVSNSRYVAYTASNNASFYKVMQMLVGGTIPSTAKIKLTINGATVNGTTPDNGKTVINYDPNDLISGGVLKFIEIEKFTESSATIDIDFMFISKTIKLERKSAITPGALFPLHSDLGVYCLSAEVAEGSDWITLHPSSYSIGDEMRNDTQSITVEDGKINLQVTAGSGRTGTVYLTTIKDPTASGGAVYDVNRRIKIDIIQ